MSKAHHLDEAKRLVQYAAENKSTSINLSGLRLETLPAGFSELHDLETVDLSLNRFKKIPRALSQLPKLTDLDLSANQLKGLQPDLNELKNLRSLNLRLNKLDSLTDALSNLVNLAHLILDGNRLQNIPLEICTLASLKVLSLEGNQISEIDSAITSLTRLKRLNLSRNELESLPPYIGSMRSLDSLEIQNNPITKLPSSLANLTDLKILDANFCQLNQLPKNIGKLQSLRELHLFKNQLTSLPQSICEISTLEELAILGNKIKKLPESIGNLASLRSLWAQNNFLKRIPESIELMISLRQADFSNNPIDAIPYQICNLKDLDTFNVLGTQLAPSIVSAAQQGTPYLRALLQALIDPSDVTGLKEVKLLITGEGGVGKTTLRKSLDNTATPKHDEQNTWGLDYGHFQIADPNKSEETITVNYWDFAGQQVYRITQQFFYSEHGIYLLVWDPRRGEDQCMIIDWLNRISARTKNRAKIIIVATHAKAIRGAYSWKVDLTNFDDDIQEMVVSQVQVDSLEDFQIDELRKAIICATKSTPGYDHPINKSWLAARAEALGGPKSSPWLNFSELQRICQRHGIIDGEAVETIASSYIHRTGRGLWYGVDSPNDPYLRDTIVRDPSWLAMAFMQVMEHRPTQLSGGILNHDQLEDVWCNHGNETDGWTIYRLDDFARLLRMLQEQGVALPTKGSNGRKSLIPQLVPKALPELPWVPEEIQNREEKILRMTTNLEPSVEGFFPRLLASFEPYHHYPKKGEKGSFWSDGVFLRDFGGRYNNEALVTIHYERTLMKLEVFVCGDNPSFLFNIIDETITNVCALWPGVERFDLLQCKTQTATGLCNGTFNLENVLRWMKNNETGKCQECDTTIYPGHILAGIKPQQVHRSYGVEFDDLGYLKQHLQRPAPASVVIKPAEKRWKDIKSWSLLGRVRLNASLYSEFSGQFIAEIDFTADQGLLKYLAPAARLGALFFGAPLPFELPPGVEETLDEMSDTFDRVSDFGHDGKSNSITKANLYLMSQFLSSIGLDPRAHGMDLGRAPNAKWYWMSQDEVLVHSKQPAAMN
ncbi:leucine-rich repeat domain-containing protein [Roseobacter sp. A03A-229]